MAKVYPVADLVLPIEIPRNRRRWRWRQCGGGQQAVAARAVAAAALAAAAAASVAAAAAAAAVAAASSACPTTPRHAAPADVTLSKPAQSRSHGLRGHCRSPAIEIDRSVSPDVFWNSYFAKPTRSGRRPRRRPAQLMQDKEFDQVIAMIQAALAARPAAVVDVRIARHRDGARRPFEGRDRAGRDVGRRLQHDARRADVHRAATCRGSGSIAGRCSCASKWSKIEPLRREAYALGLRAAQRCDDLAGIQWATVGILSQAWPNDEAADREDRDPRWPRPRSRGSKKKAGTPSSPPIARSSDAAIVRDCVVQVSWTGNADVDLSKSRSRPARFARSAEPRTTAGGVSSGRRVCVGRRRFVAGVERSVRLPAGVCRHLSRADSPRVGRRRRRQGDRRRVSRICGSDEVAARAAAARARPTRTRWSSSIWTTAAAPNRSKPANWPGPSSGSSKSAGPCSLSRSTALSDPRVPVRPI